MEKEKIYITTQELVKEVPVNAWILNGLGTKTIYVLGWIFTVWFLLAFTVGFMQGLTGN